MTNNDTHADNELPATGYPAATGERYRATARALAALTTAAGPDALTGAAALVLLFLAWHTGARVTATTAAARLGLRPARAAAAMTRLHAAGLLDTHDGHGRPTIAPNHPHLHPTTTERLHRAHHTVDRAFGVPLPAGVDPAARVTLVALALLPAHTPPGRGRPTADDLAAVTGRTTRTTRADLAEFAAAGLVTVDHTTTPTRYTPRRTRTEQGTTR